MPRVSCTKMAIRVGASGAMRVVRKLLQAVLLVLTLVVGAVAASIIVSQTAWFRNWLRGYIVSQANQYLNGELTIGRLGGNLFFGVELEDVGVTMDGAEVASVQDLGVDFSIFDLISHGMTIDDIRLNKPVLYLRREGETWSIARLIKRQEAEADREGPSGSHRHLQHRHQRRIDRPRRRGRHLGRGHSGSPRSARRAAVVQVRARALLDRDRARVVSRIGAGDQP